MKASIEGGHVVVRDGEDFSVAINLIRVFEQMSAEERAECAKAICWNEILREAVARLCGRSECWSGDDAMLTAEVLAAMEKFALVPCRLWTVLRSVNEAAHEMVTCERRIRALNPYCSYEAGTELKPIDEFKRDVLAAILAAKEGEEHAENEGN